MLTLPKHNRYDYSVDRRAQGLLLAGRQAAGVLH